MDLYSSCMGDDRNLLLLLLLQYNICVNVSYKKEPEASPVAMPLRNQIAYVSTLTLAEMPIPYRNSCR